jgi:hypothetical protein
MSGENTRLCGTPTLKDFAFVNPQVQRAANMVYTQKQTYDSLPANVNSQKKYNFKSDFERMQYKLGTLGASRNGGGGCGTGQK